jgi:hypothetical protein
MRTIGRHGTRKQLQFYLIALELNGERVAVHDQLDVGSAIDVEERGALLALVLPARTPVHTVRLLACEAVSVCEVKQGKDI